MLDKYLLELQGKIRRAAFLAEAMVGKAATALIEKRRDLALEVIEKDEEEMDHLDLEIDEAIITILARYHPIARDLRLVLSSFSVNRHLERVGDHSVNIAEYVLDLIPQPPVKPLIDIPRMATISREMLKDAIDSLMEEDVDKAMKVIDRDEEVDNLLEQVRRELVTYMISDPKTIDRALKLTSIARNLERIADLATNIAENAVFLVKGKMIKHRRP
ncbi:MAG: phosphate transport system regulatory protein PhoU [Aquificota bacterium]|nr:MAG: phosphate transport system regulatory protein PhoU [Aquificota bacterium]